MKNNSKRICALLLAIVMCITCVVPVFAESADHEHSDAETAIACPGEGAKHVWGNCPTAAEPDSVVEPTCENFGYELYTCLECGEPVIKVIKDQIAGGKHVWDESKTVDVAPTCTAAGSITKVCGECGKTVTTEYGAALGHKVAPGSYLCSEGMPAHDVACEVCGEAIHIEAVEPGKCKFVFVELVINPTCTLPGVAIVKCANLSCQNNAGVEVAVECKSVAHSWVKDGDFTSDPSCVAPGSGFVKCEICGDTTAVENGYVISPVLYGAVAVETVSEKIDAFFVPHNFSGEKGGSAAATCDSPAIVAHYNCANAGCDAVSIDGTNACKVEDLFEGEKLDHTWGDEVAAKVATCKTEGNVAYKICTACEKAYLIVATNEVVTDASKLVIAPSHEYGDIVLDENGLLARDKNGKIISKPSAEKVASCNDFGFYFFACSKCGAPASTGADGADAELPYDQEGFVAPGVYRFPAEGCKFDIFVEKVDAKCGVAGYVKTACSVCGEIDEEPLPALEHVWETVVIPATCASVSCTYEICKACGEKRNEVNGTEKDPENHNWIRTPSTTAPTCTNPGIDLLYCPDCDVAKTVPGEADTYHKFTIVEKEESYPNDCTKDGYRIYKCEDCKALSDKMYEADLKGTAHDYTSAEAFEATCESAAHTDYKCGNCSFIDKRYEGTKLEHKYEIDLSKTVAPVCTGYIKGSDGKYVLSCANGCGSTKDGEKIVFDWNNPDHHKSATKIDSWYVGECVKTTVDQYECANCASQFHHIVAEKAAHTIKAGTFVDVVIPACGGVGAYAHFECAVCDKLVMIVDGDQVVYTSADELKFTVEHVWVEAAAAKAPTCTEDGALAYYICSTCGIYTVDKNVTFEAKDIVANTTIPAAHTFGDVLGEKVAPTCTSEGSWQYSVCGVCAIIVVYADGGEFLTNNEADIVIPALSHNPIPVTEDTVYTEDGVTYHAISKLDCWNAGYAIAYCDNCDEIVVADYEFTFGHKFGEDLKQLPTCSATGLISHYECEVCNGKYLSNEDVWSTDAVEAEDLIDNALAHINAAGVVITDSCQDTVADRLCIGCGETIGKSHKILSNDVDASCTDYGYVVEVCAYCDYENVEKKLDWEPKGHKYEWVLTTEPGNFTAGEETYKCTVCGASEKDPAETRPVAPIGGIEFSFALDNAIYSGAEYVNGGKIKLTISYKAANVDLANIMLRLDYKAEVLTYVSGDFVCDAFDIKNAGIGGNEAGTVVISAKSTGFGEEVENMTLTGEGVFAIIYFDINKAAPAGSDIDFEVIRVGNSASQVLKALEEKDEAGRITYEEVPAIYGTPDENGKVVAEVSKLLADIDTDGSFTNADEVEFLDIAFSDGYIAAADINQDGFIGLDDYDYLYNLILKNITYEELCEAAQA